VSLISEPTAIAVFLIVLIGILHWISTYRFLGPLFKYLPPAIWVYFLPMASSNLGIIPQSSSVYDWIRLYLLPSAPELPSMEVAHIEVPQDFAGFIIEELSRRKGGREELRRLLPQFDQALASLRSQQQAIFERFDEQLELLRTGEAFREVAANVREVIREFQAYVDAGGNLARANEFLSLSLQEIRAASATALAEGEEQAIENVLRLNQLLLKREQILADAADRERDIRTRGVLERQQTVAQTKAQEIEAVRRQRDERLAEIDQEIRVLQLKVDAESSVFEVATDRIALETRLLELKAAEFDREVAQLAALRDIVAGIVPTAAGLAGLTPALRTELNLGTVQIFLGDNSSPAQARVAGEEVIESMLQALIRQRERLGLLTT